MLVVRCKKCGYIFTVCRDTRIIAEHASISSFLRTHVFSKYVLRCPRCFRKLSFAYTLRVKNKGNVINEIIGDARKDQVIAYKINK